VSDLAPRVADAEPCAEAGRLVTRRAGKAVASAIAARDRAAGGPEAEREASVWPGWVDPPPARPLTARIEGPRETPAGRGVPRVRLAGTGGPPLAPAVIGAAAAVTRVVLDTTEPGPVADAPIGDRAATVPVARAGSGSTMERDGHRRVVTEGFPRAGLNPTEHTVVVTDAGCPPRGRAARAGPPVVKVDPRAVGGGVVGTARGRAVSRPRPTDRESGLARLSRALIAA